MYFTKEGDFGKTQITEQAGISKDSLIIETLGQYDELSCILGIASSFSNHKQTINTLENLQNDIHTVCAEISGKGLEKYPIITNEHIDRLEQGIEKIEGLIGKQKSFLLPGGTTQASLIQLARAVSRRGERALIKLSKKNKLRQELLIYANRLSSFLYVLARIQNHLSSRKEKSPVYGIFFM